jgi:uncharacterized protein (TIGR03083 family)
VDRVPTLLTFDDHVAAIDRAGTRLGGLAVEAGLDSRVPTCPAWDVRALLAHQTMVHRWAASVVRGDESGPPNQTEIRATTADLPAYYREGLAALLDALRDAPTDLSVMTFLNDAPPARQFWARRQAHETTVHMVDALGSVAGAMPDVTAAGVDPVFAADGIDELLRGFLTRGRSKPFAGDQYTIAVEATDVGRTWVVEVAERLTVAQPGTAPDRPAVTVTGPAAAIYLTLWNRSATATVEGRPDFVERWRTTQRIGWS